MRILIACEESQVVTKEFRKLGHEAYSCDILPCSGGRNDWHLQQDVIPLLQESWDMIIAFPPCTYLCSSGLHWNKRVPGREQKTKEALEFVRNILNAPCKKIALENPIGCISTKIRKYSQIIQPWQFGHDASKQTCLWLKNLPKLKHTKIIPPKNYSPVVYASQLPLCDCCEEPFCNTHNLHYWECDCIGPTQDEATYKTIGGYEFATLSDPAPKPVWGNQTPSGQNKLGPSEDRARLRSITYYGIAKAMAEQWDKFIRSTVRTATEGHRPHTGRMSR